jgi:type I restriction enzyme S subunit
MQKLFTEGIKGEKQKQTEIGLVPESWEVVELGDYLEKTNFKDPTKNPNEEFIYVDVSSVSNELFKVIETNTLLGKDAPSRARN